MWRALHHEVRRGGSAVVLLGVWSEWSVAWWKWPQERACTRCPQRSGAGAEGPDTLQSWARKWVVTANSWKGKGTCPNRADATRGNTGQERWKLLDKIRMKVWNFRRQRCQGVFKRKTFAYAIYSSAKPFLPQTSLFHLGNSYLLYWFETHFSQPF